MKWYLWTEDMYERAKKENTYDEFLAELIAQLKNVKLQEHIEELLKMGFTLYRIAELTGIPYSTIHAYSTGERVPVAWQTAVINLMIMEKMGREVEKHESNN